jgi:cytochrome o ubiquinol oxidase subunit 1
LPRSRYWFPKVFGFTLDERTGKWFFWTFSAGTALLFTAMFALGFMGETRRLDYLYDTHWLPALVIEEIGIGFYTLSAFSFSSCFSFPSATAPKTSSARMPGARPARWNG